MTRRNKTLWAMSFVLIGNVSLADTLITFDSEPGDWVGGGKKFTLTPEDGQFFASTVRGGVEIRFDGNDYWMLTFVGPQASRFIPGPYEGATRYPFNSSRTPGLSVSGAGRGCNTLTGRFDVLEIEIGPGGQVERFAANFEQHCEGGKPALFGTVLFNSSGPPFPPPPDTDADGLPDTVDNCPGAQNPGQEDGDLDGAGDACDEVFNNTKIIFDSQPGDYIGGGKQFTLTPRDGLIRASASGSRVEVSFSGDASWTLSFEAPEGSQLSVGPYEGATRYPFNSPRTPGLSVSGAGRGCNILTGRFDILEIEVTPGGEVQRFAANFEQHCEGGVPALFGTALFNASGPPFPPPPDTDADGLPDTADNCPAAENPGQEDGDLDGIGDACDEVFNNTKIIFDSQPGDYIGGGKQFTLTPRDGQIRASASGSRAEVSFNGNGSWMLYFEAPEGSQLSVGPYEGAARYPFNSRSKPGLSVSGAGRGCNTLTGRFDILEIQVTPGGDVERFAASFEQHCEGGVPALFGTVLFNASGPPFPPPPDSDSDGLPDTMDNCPGAQNPGQEDGDLDGMGDACDEVFNNTKIIFDSQPGDYIGGGKQLTLTPRDGDIQANSSGSSVEVNFNGDDWWTLSFEAPEGSRLSPGPYEGATRYPFNSPRKPGLSIHGAGRGCNTSTGRFDILEIEVTPGGEVKRFAASFEQHCDGGVPALFGTVLFNASGPPFPPPPDTDADGLPDTADNCPGAQNPEQEDGDLDGIGDACDGDFNNTVVFLDSQSGDWVGGGTRRLLTPADGTFSCSGSLSAVSLYFSGDHSWHLDFAPPRGQELSVGSYEGATRYPFQDAGEPGLSVSGAGAGCNTLRGRFDVLEIVVGGDGKIERFAAEFEQHCEGGNAALFGSVRFNSTLRTQFQDCNDNGFHDARDIAEHFSMDSDGDGILNECESNSFVRSNANADARTDMADPIFILNYLFMGSTELSCEKSADSDDSGEVNISDAIHLLRYLFLAGESPGQPFASCGPDPTLDGLTCQSFAACSGP